jgi:hypothetical protein
MLLSGFIATKKIPASFSGLSFAKINGEYGRYAKVS